MNKNYLNDRSNENNRSVKNAEKVLKYERRRYKVEATEKIAKDLEDADTQHNSKIL